MIVEMQTEALSLRDMARCFTQMRVPTKFQGRSWHPEIVKSVLLNNLQNKNERII